MLKIFDQQKNPLGYIVKYTDLKIEGELSTGDKTLSFTYRAKKGLDIRNEFYIETKEDRYVVKEVGISSDDFPTFVCRLDLEDLEAEMLEMFSAVDVTLTDAANLALAGTGWRVDTDITKKRSVGTMKVTPLSALGKIKDAWMCEMRFDTKNKVVYFREKFGEDKGVFFTKSLNLRKLELTSDSYDYYTRIIPIGADNLRINDVNGGKEYVENYQYSNKIRTLIWEDTNYEDAEALKEDAEKKLDDMSKPVKSYSADIIDLAAQRPEYSIMSFGLGDTILLLDKETGIKEKQRIVKMTEYPQEPEKNTCELSNTTLTFEEMQDRLEDAAKAVEDITNADGTVNGYYVHGVEADGIVGIEVVINGSSAIKDINSELSSMSGAIVDINGSLSAAVARIGTLETTALTATEADLKYATIEQLNVTNQTVHSIQGDYADFKTVVTDELAAKGALIENIQGDLASYKTVVADELTAAKGWMLEGAIGDAQISDLSANKIKAGTINTALVTVASADGAVEITGDQIMVNDVTDASNPINRVIVGKYNVDSDTIEYGLLVRSADGQTVMIDGDGVHNAGITDGAVDNNKVANDANIAGSKLDINSVVTEINGATEKISSTVVQVGDKTLQVYLGEQENIIEEYGETLTSQAAQIAANEESIALKVSTQEFSSYKTAVANDISAAKTDAINTAASDATEKANAAQSAAVSAAAKDAQTKADAAQSAAITAAAADATTKANNAKNEAINTAASDAATKAAQALADAKGYTDDEIAVVSKSLSTASADISVLKDQIALKVEQTDINEAVYTVQQSVDEISEVANSTNSYLTTLKNQYGYPYKKDIVIYGESDLYYPVVIKGGNQNVTREIVVTRTYGEQGPYEWSGSNTHIGALNLKLKANFGGWGGAVYEWYIDSFTEEYCTQFAGALVGGSIMSGGAFAIFLRGGGETGAMYHIYSDQDLGLNPYSNGGTIPASPHICYEQDMIGKSGTYEWFAPAPREMTDAVQEEIKNKKHTNAVEMANDISENLILNYSTTTQMNAAITAAKDSITSAVSQTYATKAELSTEAGKISILETWKTEASQKITKEGIISTVGNYYAYESDLSAAEQRLTTAESSITQNAAGITVALQSAEDAAKTATNFLKFENNGLVIGNMTGSSLGNNVLIDSDSVDIRSGNTVVASYGTNTIYLGKNSTSSQIDLCNGLATIRNEKTSEVDGFTLYSHKSIYMHSDMKVLMATYGSSTANLLFITDEYVALTSRNPDTSYPSLITVNKSKGIIMNALNGNANIQAISNDVRMWVKNGANIFVTNTIARMNSPNAKSYLHIVDDNIQICANGKAYNLPSFFDSLNSKIIYESIVTTFYSATSYLYVKRTGYRLLSAINGDWNAQSVRVTGVARQYDTDIVFFEKAVTGSMRIDLLWVRP